MIILEIVIAVLVAFLILMALMVLDNYFKLKYNDRRNED